MTKNTPEFEEPEEAITWPDPEPVASVTQGPDVAVTFKPAPQVVAGAGPTGPIYRCSVCNAAFDRQPDTENHIARH